MRTIAIKSAFVAIVIMMTGILSVSAQSDQDFFFDKKYSNEKVVSSTKYELGFSGLYEKTQLTTYSYDESGSLNKVEYFAWNAKKANWTPVHCINYSRHTIDNSLTLELAMWNKKENKYNPVSERAVYWMDDLGKVISWNFSKKGEKTFEETATINQLLSVNNF